MRFFVKLVDSLALVDFILVALSWMVDHTDLVVFIDEVAIIEISGNGQVKRCSGFGIPKLFEISREDWIFGKSVGKTAKHAGKEGIDMRV